MQKTKIEWVRNPDGKQGIVFNPVIGCKNNCYYCYGKELNRRFKWIEDWTKPENCGEDYYTKSICQIYTVRPKTIFIGSITDLFGKWVRKETIEHYLIWTKENPQHTFLFLTKNSARYLEFNFPKNCWLGVTLTGDPNFNYNKQYEIIKALPFLKKKNKKFISFEPLMSKIMFLKEILKGIDWVIIGAMTKNGKTTKEYAPKFEWIKNIVLECKNNKIPVFLKNNLISILGEKFVKNNQKIPYLFDK